MFFGERDDGGWEITGTERELRDMVVLLGEAIDDGEAEATMLSADGVRLVYASTVLEGNGHS